LALDFVRKHGFDREFQAHYGLEYSYVMDKTVTDLDVEKMMARLVAETHELLKENIKFLLALSSALRTAGRLEAPAVAAIATQFGVPVIVKPEGYLHLPKYAAELATQTEKSEK
jgi:hypothetical protein